jgi:hypothetical protein
LVFKHGLHCLQAIPSMSSFDSARFESEQFDLSSALKDYRANYQVVDKVEKTRIRGVIAEIYAYVKSAEYQQKCEKFARTTPSFKILHIDGN